MTAAPSLTTRRVLVTGADGFLGRGVVAALAREGVSTLVAADVREVPADRRLPGVTMEARCTTLSMACAASVCASAGSRTSCTR